MGASESVVGQKGAVRLRKPERRQLAMVVQCADDLVRALHPVRTVMAVVEKLDVSGFCEPIRAREGIAGRDATDPRLLVGLWLYACVRGIGSARELARRCEESAPFRWLCGGVGVNHRLLSDFRTDHADALDGVFTQVLVSLVDKKLVHVSRISQDGVRIRVSAGSSSFRREERLQQLLVQAQQQVLELRKQLESPAQSGAVTARQKAARRRAAESRQQRLEQAIAQLPELKKKQAEAAQRAGQGKCGDQIRARQPRVSTTDAATRGMKMANGGFNPAANVQLATDTESRAILGVEVSNEGSDSAGLSEPMRQQVQQRGTAPGGRRLLAHGGHRRCPPARGGVIRASQTSQKPAEPGARVRTEAERFASDSGLEATHGKRRRQENLQTKGRHQRDGKR
jgi:transposase